MDTYCCDEPKDALGHTVSNESQIQLLSYIVTKLLPPSERAAALVCRDTCERLRLAERQLRRSHQILQGPHLKGFGRAYPLL